MIGIDDIDVFVLSYNREEYIKVMLESLLCQTVGEFVINILDNGSKDDTKKVVEGLGSKRIRFIGSETNNGALWNFQRAQKLAKRRYTVMFHDDDIIHPRYLEYALRAINEFDDISIVSSGMKATTQPNIKYFKDYRYNPIYFDNISKFASLVYLGFPLNYATVIYNTEFLKKVDMKALNEQYGKISDRPTVYEAAKNGNIVLLPGQYIQYRIHSSQDSGNSKTGPFEDETLSLHKYYKETIFNDNQILPKIYFLINFYKYINSEYDRFYDSRLSKNDYIDRVVKELGLKKKEVLFSKMCYLLHIGDVFKIYRFFRREFGEYS